MTHDTPTWTVRAVRDDEGDGHGYACTVGLSDVGHPEMFMASKPANRPDYPFCGGDLRSILDEYAQWWLEDRLRVGDRCTHQLGCSDTLAVTVGRPAKRLREDDSGARPIDVVPLHWEVLRDPLGPGADLPPAAQRAWRQRIVAASAEVPRAAGLPPVPSDVDFDTDQTYGPLTAWVLLLAHAAATAAPAQVLISSLGARSDGDVEAARAEVSVRAWSLGRQGALEVASLLADDVTAGILRRPAFHSVVPERAETAVRMLLCSAVVEDDLPEESRRVMQEPWRGLSLVMNATRQGPVR